MLEFAEGRAQLIAVRVTPGSPLRRTARIGEFRERLSRRADARGGDVPAGRPSSPASASTRIRAGDEVFLLADAEQPAQGAGAMHSSDKPVRRVMIAGGGNVGLRLARRLARHGARSS